MKENDRIFKVETLSNKRVARRTIVAFSALLVADILGYKAFKWIARQPKAAGTPEPLRAALNANEKVFSAFFDADQLVTEYPVSAAAKKVRVNGKEGLENNINEAAWKLNVIREDGSKVNVSLDDIKRLPKKEIVFNFKCIEGWSQIMHWGGVPLKTFVEHYGLNDEANKKYIGLQSVDKRYYVGIDMPSALHPQTLLAYEMNSAPLSVVHGYPLRLIIPVKYGIKHLKQIGTLFFSNDKPADFWAERGYDYYAGH